MAQEVFPGVPPEAVTLPWVLPWQVLHAASKTVQLAPDVLQQSINSGWAFGNIHVNSNNSSAPDTELAIVAKASYGSQLGRLMDAVDVLARQLAQDGGAAARLSDADRCALDRLAETRAEIEATKAETARRRVSRLATDLACLSKADPAAWRAVRAELAALLASTGG